jgi:Ca2+-binding EF-hand superfamily protein
MVYQCINIQLGFKKKKVYESLEEHQVEDFKIQFLQVDKSNSGYITKEEFKQIISTRSFDLNPTDYEIDLLVDFGFFL